MKVIVATDGSDEAIAAAKRGVALLADPAEVLVIDVVEPTVVPVAGGVDGALAPVPALDESGEVDAALTREASDALAKVAAAFDRPVTTRVEHGDPAMQICRVAADEHADVVVIGASHAGVVRRVLLGSVSEHVVHHAPCPVLVVREAR